MTLVLVEIDGDDVAELSAQAVTFARETAAATGAAGVHAVVVGALPDDALKHLAMLGVDAIHVAEHEAFASGAGYAAAAWASAVVTAAQATEAAVVTAAGSSRGNEVLAHVAARLGAPMAANAVGLASAHPFAVTRQVMGGAVLEEMVLAADRRVVSVAGHAVEATPAASPGAATVSTFAASVTEADLRARVIRLEAREGSDTGRLAKAKVVVGAGRGAGGPEGFDACIALADRLGGTLGVSRVVTSLGWRPHHEQVGQTGTRISPDLYIPCGISGAIQHWAGCSSSQTILAINTDAEAPMMTKATYAVVGDMHEVVPAILDELG